MKKTILIAVLMLVSSSVFAQDIFGPPNYFFKRNDSVFVRPGSVFGSASSQNIDTSTIPFLSQNNTFTGTVNTFTGKMVVGTGTSNGTADFLVMGDTTTIRGTVYRDSSYLRVLVNPFSQRIKFEMKGKIGTNMLTIDSTLITTALGITTSSPVIGSTFSSTNGADGFKAANSGYFYWSGRSSMRSSADGKFEFTNTAENGFTTFQVGANLITAKLGRGTTDTDITYMALRDGNGVEWFFYPNTSGVLQSSATIP